LALLHDIRWPIQSLTGKEKGLNQTKVGQQDSEAIGRVPELSNFPVVCSKAKTWSELLTLLDYLALLGSGFQPLMFPSTVTALERRKHQPDRKSEADFCRQERSHPGGKWGQLGHRCFQPSLLRLKVFYTIPGLRRRKMYIYTTVHQTTVNRMLVFLLL